MQSDSVGVERRRLPFTLIENIILEDQTLSRVDILVYLAIAKHADGEGTCWPSMATIGKLARCARETVARSLTRLESRGYLKRSARFRPDGGVTSNVYQLMPLEAHKYPPVAQEDTPCDRESQPPVSHDHTNYIQSELDPENQKRGERVHRPAARLSLPRRTPVPKSVPSLSVLLTRIKQEAQARKAPLVVGRDWSEGIAELTRSGIPEEELIQAFATCVETAPERVTFFPRDFLKWRKASRDRVSRDREQEHQRREREEGERERKAEREKVLAEQSDPQSAARLEAAIAGLPWKRVRE